MLIEQITAYGSFELIYLGLATAGKFLPTVFALYTGLSQQGRQIVLILALIFGRKIFVRIVELLKRFKNYLIDKL